MPSQMVLDLPNHREITFSEIRWINRGCFFSQTSHGRLSKEKRYKVRLRPATFFTPVKL